MMPNCFKKSLLLLLCVGAIGFLGARELVYYVDMNTFYDQQGGAYVEYYLDVDAASVGYELTEDGKFGSAVDVRLEVTDAVTGEHMYDRHYELVGPPLSDTSAQQLRFGIMDVRRIALEPGRYVFTGFLKDLKNPDSPEYKFVRDLEVLKPLATFPFTSDLEFIQSFRPTMVPQGYSKHGYDIVPLVTNGNFVDQDSLKYYLELYHPERQTEQVFFVNAFISLANSTNKIPGYQKILRMAPKELSLIQGGFDIRGLPSQTYYLHLEIYNQKQELMSDVSEKFYVVNSRMEAPSVETLVAYDEHFTLNEEELDYYIHTLYYISSPTERDFANALSTLDEKQKYFLNFWYKRKENPDDSPAKPWRGYKSRVDHANKNFKAAHLEGWRTDRGRVMLTYGPPNDVERFPSSNTNYPYEVWHYNKIKTQANLQFIFFNPNMATDEYVLLHSNALGEQNNPRWEFEVIRTVQDGNLDVNSIRDDFGN